jgi:hypothetical protein
MAPLPCCGCGVPTTTSQVGCLQSSVQNVSRIHSSAMFTPVYARVWMICVCSSLRDCQRLTHRNMSIVTSRYDVANPKQPWPPTGRGCPLPAGGRGCAGASSDRATVLDALSAYYGGGQGTGNSSSTPPPLPSSPLPMPPTSRPVHHPKAAVGSGAITAAQTAAAPPTRRKRSRAPRPPRSVAPSSGSERNQAATLVAAKKDPHRLPRGTGLVGGL